MEETRVSKYKQYRKSISKKGSKSFLAPFKKDEVSNEMGLFLKIDRRRKAENITILSLCAMIIIVLIIFGFIVF